MPDPITNLLFLVIYFFESFIICFKEYCICIGY